MEQIDGAISHLVSVVAVEKEISKKAAEKEVAELLLEKARNLGAVFADSALLKAVQNFVANREDIDSSALLEVIMETVIDDNDKSN